MRDELRIKRLSNRKLSDPIGINPVAAKTNLATFDGKQIKVPLHLPDEKYYKAFQCNPDPITITTLGEGRYLEVNDAFLEASGYDRYEVIGRTALELNIWLSKEDRDFWVKQLRERGYVYRGDEIKFRGKHGTIRTFLFSTEIISVAGIPHLLWVTKDITERKRIEEALRLSEEKFSRAFNFSPDPMFMCTLKEACYVEVNDAWVEFTGHERHEIIGRTAAQLGLWLDGDRELMMKQVREKKKVRNFETKIRTKLGEIKFCLFSAEIIEADGKKYLLSITKDITDRKRIEEEVKYLIFHDKLTGLYNRAYFENEIKRLAAKGEMPISLIMGDVNGLKLINDALGHQEGDNLLKAVAGILQQSCRQDDIVARWGGDEFIILLPGCESDNAAKVLERIRDCCKGSDSLPIQNSLSLGIATMTNRSKEIIEIVKEAEDKMYRNKLLQDRSTRSSFLVSLERTLWTRSHETEAHCRRLQEMAIKIGTAIGLPESELDNLSLVAVLHDIGKIAIPNCILDKPGKLNGEEWETIKKHPEIGYRIALSSIEMAPIAEVILHHHERWDGTGYPLGIQGQEIPLSSRIIAIADSYDVMIHGRPYQTAVNQEIAWEEIKRCAGTQFDPDLVEKAVDLFTG